MTGGARRLRVLFLEVDGSTHRAYEHLVAAVDGRHDVVRFDPASPRQPQFDGVDVVVDEGGSGGTQALVDCGAAAGVKLWQVLGTGLDHFDLAHLRARGLSLANTPGRFSAVAVAEHALLLVLSLVKNLNGGQRSVRSGRFERPLNDELNSLTLGILGLGASGLALASRASALGMRVIGVDVAPPDPATLARCGVESCRGLDDLSALLEESDVLSLHVPLTARTRHLVDRAALAHMKPGAMLVNVARGAIVDEEALVEALASGRLRGAALDVFEREPPDPQSPLVRLENVVVTPHLAGATHGTVQRRAEAAAENLDRLARGEPPLYLVEWLE